MGTNLLHWINILTLGAVVIMMLRNKYDKLYKNIHRDDQLRQRERKRDERWEDEKTERKLLQLVFVIFSGRGCVHMCTGVRNYLLFLLVVFVTSVLFRGNLMKFK